MKNEKPLIIGVSGAIGVGKNTFCEEFAKLSKIPVQQHAFADKLKETVQLITGYKMQMTHESGKPFYNPIYNYTQNDKNIYIDTWGRTIGEILQILGTEALRDNFDKDVWVKALFESSAKDAFEHGHILIISDVRFVNEADYVINNGGILIRLEGDPMSVRLNSKRDVNHVSETALNDYGNFNEVIINDIPDINVLRGKIEDFMVKYGIDKKNTLNPIDFSRC
jgi:hypothetical protein